VRKHLYAAVMLLALAALVPYDLSRSGLPFYRFWGVDFQNLHAFHHCEVRNAPYDNPQAAQICGDAVDRPMRYPPLLYWSFAWTRLFPFPVALKIWTVFILAGTYVGVTLFLSREALSQRRVQVWIGLLFAQFPALYAIERGNNDVWIVLLWGLACFAFTRGRPLASGVFAGLAVAAKVYPLFAVLIVVVALLEDRRTLMRFATGVASAGAAAALLFLPSTISYVSVLREFAGEFPRPSVQSHGLPAFFSPLGVAFLGGTLLLSWAGVAFRLRRSGNFDLLFAGALSIATFFSTTSNDYNLITTYPLMAVLFVRSLEPATWLMRASLVVLMIGMFAPRIYFFGGGEHQRVALLILGLVIAAAAALRASSTTPPAAPEPLPH
jgi:hypothetical protein